MPNYRLERDSIQWQFDRSRAKIQIMSGGFGNGKTTAAVMKGLKLANYYPGSTGLIARGTYPKLNDTIRKETLKWCPSHWVKRRPTQDDNTLHLNNQSIIQFRYIQQKGKAREDGETTSNLLSASYDWIVVDQIEDPEIVHKDFLDLAGRLRGDATYNPPKGDPVDESMPLSGPRWLIATANPSQGWFFREVVNPYFMYRDRGAKTEKLIVDEQTGECLVDLFEGSTYTNKANLKEDYIRMLEAMYKGQMRKRFLLGEWAAFEGLVHSDYNMAVHLLTRQQVMDHIANCFERHVKLQVIEGYDWGQVSPTCYLFAIVDDYGRVIVVDGFYIPEFPYDRHPEKIAEIRDKWRFSNDHPIRVREPIIADPAIFRRQVVRTDSGPRKTGESIANLLREMHLELRPGSNDIQTGIAKVNTYLAGHAKVPHLITGEFPGPLLYFVDDLEFIQEEIGSYYWKKNTQGVRIDEPIDSNDHSMNVLKYMLSKRPEVSKIVLPKDHLPPGWLFWQEEGAAA